MRNWKRHIGVLIILFVSAAVLAWVMPLSVDPRLFFYGATVLYFLYLGASFLKKGGPR